MTLSAFTRSGRGFSSLSTALALGVVLCAGPAAAQVESRPLDALDLWSAPGADTGLGPDLWKDASAEAAKAALADLEKTPPTPAFAGLARRVLASGAAAPSGLGADRDAAGARANLLIRLGDPAAAQAILSRATGVETNAALTRAKAEAALLYGRDDEACAAGQALQQDRDSPWALQLRAFCQLHAGETAAAQVTLDLWRQRGGRDPAFDRLASAAAGGTDPGAPALDSALGYALTRHLKLDPEAGRATASPAVSAVLAPIPAGPDAPTPTVLSALAAGDLATARSLRAGMTPEASEAAGALDLALLDASIAAAGGDAAGPTLDRLIERGGLGDAKARVRAQSAALLLAALGAPLSPGARDELSGFEVPAGKAGPARLAALDDAAANRLVGATALMALRIGQTANLPVADRAAAVRALRRVGLETDARAIALEGLLALQRK